MSEIMTDNSALTTVRTPNLIAAEINNIKDQTRKMVLYNSIEIGRRLVEAKQILSHGEWGQWLEKSVDYSQRTANNLMRIFQEYGADQLTFFGDNAKSQAFANLSYSQAVALLGIHEEDEREKFIKENDVENMSTRELQKAIKEKEKALKEKAALEKKLKAAKEKAELEHKSYQAVSDSYNELAKTNKEHYEQSERLRKELEMLKKEKEDSENEINKLQSSIADINKELEEAQASGNDEEVEKLQESLSKMENELVNSNNKIKELEQKLKEPKDVIVGETVVEKVPDEIQKELEELRERVNQQPQSSNESTLKFKIHFEKTVGSIKDLLTILAEIEESSEEDYERYKNAASGLLNKMLERLE